MLLDIGHWTTRHLTLQSPCLHASGTPQSGHDLFSRNRMLADPHAARVVNCVRERSGNRTNAGFAEALYPVEPAGLEAIDVQLCHLGNVHYGRKPVRQVADTVMASTWKLSVPGNGIGCNLGALDE